MTYNFNIL